MATRFTNTEILSDNNPAIIAENELTNQDNSSTNIIEKLPYPIQKGKEVYDSIKEEGFIKTEPSEESSIITNSRFKNVEMLDDSVTDFERIKYGFDKTSWLFGNLWDIGKAKYKDVLDNDTLDDKTFKQHILENTAKENEELKKEHWKFADGKYDKDGLVKISEFATAIFDPYYILAYATPWGRKATQSYKKMALFSGVTVGFDTLIRDLATTGEVNKTNVGVSTVAGGVLGPAGLKLFNVLGKYFPKSDSKQLEKIAEYVETKSAKDIGVGKKELASIKKVLADKEVIAANKLIENDLNFMKSFRIDTKNFIKAEKDLLDKAKLEIKISKLAGKKKKPLKKFALPQDTLKTKLKAVRAELQKTEIKFDASKKAYLEAAEKNFLKISEKIGNRNKLLLEKLYKEKSLTGKVMQSVLSYGTMPLIGSLGGGALDAIFGKEKGVLQGMAWGMATGATLKTIRASKVLDLATKDKFLGMAWSDNAKLWWQKSREITSGTLATRLEAVGGNTKVFGLQLLENIESPMAGKAVVNRAYTLQKTWQRENRDLIEGVIVDVRGNQVGQVKPYSLKEQADALSIVRGSDDEVLLKNVRIMELADGIKKQINKFNDLLENAGIFKEIEGIKISSKSGFKANSGKDMSLNARIKKFNDIEYYFPRVYNADKIIQNPKAFLKTIEDIFKGLGFKDYEKQAKAFLNYGKNNSDNGNFSVIEDANITNFVNNVDIKRKDISDKFFFTPISRHINNERMLNGEYKLVERVLEQKGYLVNDVEFVLNNLGSKSFKSIAFTERFGPNGEFIKPLINGIRKKYADSIEGASPSMQKKLNGKLRDEVQLVKDTINAYFDRYGNKASEAWNTGLGIISTGSNLAMLNNVFLASLGDFMQGFANARNLSAVARAIKNTSILAKSQKGPARNLNIHFDDEITKANLKPLAVEADASLADVASWISGEAAGKSLRWVNDKGFMLMGMTWLTGTARRFAYNVGVGDAYATARQLNNVVVKAGNSINSKKALEILIHVEKLGMSAEQALKLGAISSYDKAITSNLGKKILNKAGLITANRDAILPQVGNRLLFSQNRDPRYRILGQFMSWAMAKSSQTSKMLQRVENGDVKTLIKIMAAIPVYSGIQNLRELLKYGEIRTSFDYDKQKWFAYGLRLSGNLGWLSELVAGRWMGPGAKDNPLLFFPGANWVGDVWDTVRYTKEGKPDSALKAGDKVLPFPIYRRLLKNLWDTKVLQKGYSGSKVKDLNTKIKNFNTGGEVILPKEKPKEKIIIPKKKPMNKKDITAMAAAATIATGVSVNEMNKAADNNIIPLKKSNVVIEKNYEKVSELEPEKKKWLLDTAEKVYTINKDEIVPSDIILAINSGETGWGSSRFWKEGSNNLFNFQSFDDKEESIAAQNSKAKIKKFNTQEDSITQFLDWVQTKPSYKVVRDEIKLYNEGKSSKENIIKAIAKTGFAEDKNWSSKITSILNNRIDGKHKGELETLASNLFKDTNDTKN